MKKRILLLMTLCIVFFVACGGDTEKPQKSSAPEPLKHSKGSFTDSRDGQVYRTATIGSQTWFAQNLNFKNSNSFCYLKKKENCEVFGRLYVWSAAMDSACPPGWHLPSKNDFETLFNAIDRFINAGKKPLEPRIGLGKVLKSQEYWLDRIVAESTTDDYGFSVIPAGDRNYDGNFFNIKERAYFWTSTEEDENRAYATVFSFSNSGVETRYYYQKSSGFSIRCIKD